MSVYRNKNQLAWQGEVGPILEEARQKQGLSLKEAEESTRIRWRYLESLEQEDPAELPDKVYTQGFLRSYAEFLGLDPEDLTGRFKKHNARSKRHRRRRDEIGASEPTKYPEESEDGTTSEGGGVRSDTRVKHGKTGALVMLSMAGVVLALVLAAFYTLWDSSLLPGSSPGGAQSPSENVPAEERANDPSGDQGPTPNLENGSGDAQPVSVEDLRAEVSVQGAESWLSIETDSGVAYTGIAQPGFSQSFESGESLRITTGNAGAVELRINGIDYGTLGASGEVTSKSFTLKMAR